MKKIITFVLPILAVIVAGCSDSTSPEQANYIEKQAVLHWQGEYETDGCGFFAEIDGQMYKPSNEGTIAAKYKQHSESEVKIKFRYLDRKIESYCFDSQSPFEYNGIEILEIHDFAYGNLHGEWEWVESAGGIAGVTIIPETAGYTMTYNFYSDSNLAIYRNDTLITETTYLLNVDTLKIAGQDIVQLVIFKSNRIILYDQCVDCFTIVFERKGTEPELVRTSSIWYSLNLQSDPVEIKNADLSGDIIHVEVKYSGCVGHDFEIFTPAFFMESNPVQSRLELYHKSSYDMCPAITTETVSFSLVPLKEAYQDYYGQNGTIKLNLYVMGDSAAYGRQLLYEF